MTFSLGLVDGAGRPSAKRTAGDKGCTSISLLGLHKVEDYLAARDYGRIVTHHELEENCLRTYRFRYAGIPEEKWWTPGKGAIFDFMSSQSKAGKGGYTAFQFDLHTIMGEEKF